MERRREKGAPVSFAYLSPCFRRDGRASPRQTRLPATCLFHQQPQFQQHQAWSSPTRLIPAPHGYCRRRLVGGHCGRSLQIQMDFRTAGWEMIASCTSGPRLWISTVGNLCCSGVCSLSANLLSFYSYKYFNLSSLLFSDSSSNWRTGNQFKWHNPRPQSCLVPLVSRLSAQRRPRRC
jgi:hypothetical protein